MTLSVRKYKIRRLNRRLSRMDEKIPDDKVEFISVGPSGNKHVVPIEKGSREGVGPVKGVDFSQAESKPISELKSKEEEVRKRDEDYLKAVESGDMKTVQRIVEEAAKKAGYEIQAFHGTGSVFNEFDLSKSGSNTSDLTDAAEGMFFFSKERDSYPGSAQDYARHAGKKTGQEVIMPVYLKMKNPLIVDSKGWESTIAYYDKHAEDLYNKFLFGDYDGIIVRDSDANGNGGDSNTIYILDDNERIKSADLITYDDDGKIIPPSRRFGSCSKDIRF